MKNLRTTAITITRLALGLVFVVFGANGFLGFLPAPEVTAEGGAFLGALAAAGYMFPLIKGTEIVAGLLLLSHRFTPLALVLAAPIVVNIVLFHLVLSPPGSGLAVLLLLLEVGLAWAYREAFRGVLTARAKPTPAAHELQPAHA